VIGIGAFILFLQFLELNETRGNSTVVSFAWVFAIVGITLILVGLETYSLTGRLQPKVPPVNQQDATRRQRYPQRVTGGMTAYLTLLTH
jgi:hypothetical protein